MFFDDLLTNFEANDTGVRTGGGAPCYLSRLAHGRAQFTNSEVGMYTDPVLYPQNTNPYQIMDGKRALVADKLPGPMSLMQGGLTKVATYSSPIISTEKMPLFGYGRFSYRFALPNPTLGEWPAGWQLVLPHQRWPDCEQDTVELSFTHADPNKIFPYQTNWWNGNPGSRKQGQFANVFELLPGFRHQDFHDYWMEWTPTITRWGIDDILTFDPNPVLPE